MIGDLCLLETTLGCLLFSSKWRQACAGWLPSTAPGPSWTSPDCGEKWNELSSAARHIYQVFKKQSTRQTNILPVRARCSSAGTLIGRGAPVSFLGFHFRPAPAVAHQSPTGPRLKRGCLLKDNKKRMHLIWEVPGGPGNGKRSLCEPWWSETCWSRSAAHLVLCLFPAWLMFSGGWRAFVKLLSFSYSAHSSQSIKPVKVLPSCFGSSCWDFVNLLPEGSGFDSPILSVFRAVKLEMCPIALGDFSTAPDSD